MFWQRAVREANQLAQERATVELLRDNLTAARIAAAGLEAERDALRQQLAALTRERDRLLSELLELRREGFDPPRPADPAPLEVPKDLPAVVQSAIEELARPGTPLYRDLALIAAAELEAEGAKAEEVAKGLLAGGNVNPY